MSSWKGFTLIELMVVISIIAISSAVGFVSFTNAQISGRDSRRKQDLRSIQNALELFYQANKFYPNNGGAYSGSANWTSSGAGSWQTNMVPTFINQLPIDPINTCSGNVCYNYVYATLGGPTIQGYHLCATLENANDKDASAAYNACTMDGLKKTKPWNFEIDNP